MTSTAPTTCSPRPARRPLRPPHPSVRARPEGGVRGLPVAGRSPHGRRTRIARLNVLMKTEIHPTYQEAHVRCTCGNEFTTRSTQGEIHVEICSACHPFYTGRQKLVDTGGRVERFQRRVAKGRRSARTTAS